MDEIIMLFDKEELKIIKVALEEINENYVDDFEVLANTIKRVKNGLHKIEG